MKQLIIDFIGSYTERDSLIAHAVIMLDCVLVFAVLGFIHHLVK